MLDILDGLLEIIVEWIIPILLGLGYLAGLVISIILLVRSKARAAILAAVAFALLLLKHLFASPITRLAYEALHGQIAGTSVWGFNCCCGILQLAAVVCLVIAIQQGISASIPKEV
jgi:hypothetical protein